jgi:PKD repeat protein
MNRILLATILISITSAAVSVGVTGAHAAIVPAAPVWPIPADAPPGPPPITVLLAAADAAPPADRIVDPVTPTASCGGWYVQGDYGNRWHAASTWWEYRCTSEHYFYYDPCAGGGACDAFCPSCYVELWTRTDYFFWNGSDAVFYGQDYFYSFYYTQVDWPPPYTIEAWWDAPTARWYVLGPRLTVSREGGGSGVVTSAPAGISCGDSCHASFDTGTSVTLTATADASSVFAGWSGDCAGTGACQVTMDQARSVGAIFEPRRFTLTVSSAGLGHGLVYLSPGNVGCSACVESYAVGTVVMLTASPDLSSEFTGWAGACSGTGSCQVTMDQARSVTANFAASAPPNAAPVAAFTFGCSSLSCNVDGSGSADSDGTIVSYSWTFGDQSAVSGAAAHHSYAGPGTYPITLTVTDNGGATGTVTHAVTVANASPVATFAVRCTGLTCTVDGGLSVDPDGTIVSFRWSFGDGASGAGRTTEHAYPKAGSYTGTLTVTDDAGASATASLRINPISLSARGYKAGGVQKVDLSWVGPTGTSFDVYRDDTKIATVATTAYTDNVGKRPGSYRYWVCAPALSSCSSAATVNF